VGQVRGKLLSDFFLSKRREKERKKNKNEFLIDLWIRTPLSL
jgi:hypothetical protein